MATNNPLEAAMADPDRTLGVGREITAPKAYAAHQARKAERLTYAEARADLDARAGRTIQGRNSKGHFTRGVKTFTAGVAPVVQAPAKVEKRAEVTRRPVTVERDRRASVVGLSAEAA